jgi:hypothetical protein
MVNLLSDEMEDLHAIDNFVRQFDAVRNHDWLIVGIGLAGGQSVSGISSLGEEPG